MSDETKWVNVDLHPLELQALAVWHTHPDRDRDISPFWSYAGHVKRADELLDMAKAARS